jgi:membrane-associated phospholipid phosphatase
MPMPIRNIAAVFVLLLVPCGADAANLLTPIPLTSSEKRVESVGEGVAIALPLVAAGISIDKDDLTGLAQMTVDTLTTVGAAYALKHFVREERPDHSDFQSFPSDTSALAFAPASFLWDRYGWEYGVPAYAAAMFVGYSRIDAKQHHWYDVAASAGLAFVSSKIFTTEFHNRRFSYSASATPGGVAAQLNYRW